MSAFLSSRCAGAMAGLAIGDALGMPVETMTPEAIAKAIGRITKFESPLPGSLPCQQNLLAGQTTDDTQLALAIAASILNKNQLDLEDVAREHIKTAQKSTIGWGKTTLNAVKQMEERARLSRPLISFFEPKIDAGIGCGNGVAMKIAPVAIWWTLNNMKSWNFAGLFTHIKNIGFLTHPDPRASIAAFALAIPINLILRDQFSRPETALKIIINETKKAEIDYHLNEAGSFSRRLEIIRPFLDRSARGSFHRNTQELAKMTGTKCFALESVLFSIAMALRHNHDFQTGILETVNAGGDTDSTAAMAGAIIGANVGLEGIPHEWLSYNQGKFMDVAVSGIMLHHQFASFE